MKPIAIAGTVLLLLGAVVLFRGIDFKSRDSVLKIGDLNVTAEKSHDVPPWVGIVALVGGVVMIGSGMTGKRT